MDKLETIQTLLSADLESFVLMKQFPNSTGMISTFQSNSNNSYETNLWVPRNRKYRVEKMYDACPQISYYFEDTDLDQVWFDCIYSISKQTDIFENRGIQKGLLHFDVINKSIKSPERDKEINVCNINPRLLIKYHNTPISSEVDWHVSNFKVDKIKIFSAILIRGFIMGISTEKKHILYFTLNNTSENIVGNCLAHQNLKMINIINSFWSVFTTKLQNKIVEVACNKELPEFIKECKYPVLVKLEKDKDNDKVVITNLGSSLYIV